MNDWFDWLKDLAFSLVVSAVAILAIAGFMQWIVS